MLVKRPVLAAAAGLPSVCSTNSAAEPSPPSSAAAIGQPTNSGGSKSVLAVLKPTWAFPFPSSPTMAPRPSTADPDGVSKAYLTHLDSKPLQGRVGQLLRSLGRLHNSRAMGRFGAGQIPISSSGSATPLEKCVVSVDKFQKEQTRTVPSAVPGAAALGHSGGQWTAWYCTNCIPARCNRGLMVVGRLIYRQFRDTALYHTSGFAWLRPGVCEKAGGNCKARVPSVQDGRGCAVEPTAQRVAWNC